MLSLVKEPGSFASLTKLMFAVQDETVKDITNPECADFSVR